METIMAAQAIASAPYYFYTPDPNAEHRHRLAPRSGMQQMPVYPMVPTLPSTPIYSRPSSSSSQPQPQPKAMTSIPAGLTPMMSPQPLAHRPPIMLETQVCDVDGVYYPSTPPLSSAGSTIGSPNSCDMLQTPLNPMFSGLDGVEIKPAPEADASLEKFPSLDWSNCASPPMTPLYLQSNQTLPAKSGSLRPGVNISTELLSTASCPSLSPSPSPYAHSVASEVEIDFCDPRNLTVGTANSTLAPEFPALPNLCPGDEDEQQFLKGAASASPSSSFEFQPELPHGLPHGLPSFDDFSDLESDDDFVNGLVNLGEQTASSTHFVTRSRSSSDAISLGHESYLSLCEDDFEDFEDSAGALNLTSLPSSPCSSLEEDCDAHKDKKAKKSKKETKKPIMDTAADDHSADAEQQPADEQTTRTAAPDASEEQNHSDSSSPEDGNAPTAPASTPARRGRKQSLTEDPSKTFVCDLCNRRFRRQEHLKRHYRSLHTQEKPFECTECGKKFSRSDNLSQHARTHGSGAIALDFIGGGDPMAAALGHPGYMPNLMMGVGSAEDHDYGKVLFQIAAEMPGSASESSSEEDVSDHLGKKKRKRVD